MKRLLSIGLLFVLVLGSIPTNAQDDIPWPPDPSKLFDPSIKVIRTRIELPTLGRSGMSQPVFKTKCGQIIGGIDPTQWALIKRNERYYLCDLATGKLSDALSDIYVYDIYEFNDFHSGFTGDGYVVEHSPDDKWLLFVARNKGTPLQYFTYFSYDVQKHKFLKLGVMELHNDVYFYWGTDTQFVIVKPNEATLLAWEDAQIYVGNVTRSGSIKHVITTYQHREIYQPNPPRIEAHYDAALDHHFCFRNVYYFTTDVIKDYEYGELCATEYGATDSNGYYRDLKYIDYEAKTATVVRYNPVTKEQKSLYEGEVERVLWVSVNERFIAVVLDDSGKVDCTRFINTVGYSDCNQIDTASIVVFDLEKDIVLFSTPITSGDFDHSGNISSAVKQLNNNTILIRSRTTDFIEKYLSKAENLDWLDPTSYVYTLVNLPSGKATGLPIHGDLEGTITPKGWFFYYAHLSSSDLMPKLVLYDPFANISIPISKDGLFGAVIKIHKNQLILSISGNYGVEYIVELPITP